jgi:hypothetical protein
MEERIMTIHPQEGKRGVNILRKKHGTLRTAIIDSLSGENVLTFGELNQAAHQELEGKFDGSISRYITTVKLDLEARGTIERVGKNSTQQIRLVADA